MRTFSTRWVLTTFAISYVFKDFEFLRTKEATGKDEYLLNEMFCFIESKSTNLLLLC